MELLPIVLLVALVHDDAVNSHVFFVGNNSCGLTLHEGYNFIYVTLFNLLGSLCVI